MADASDSHGNPGSTPSEPPYVPPKTFGELLRNVESNESASLDCIRIADQYEAKSEQQSNSAWRVGDLCTARWYRNQAAVFRNALPDPSESPGVDGLLAICHAEFGSGLTAENLKRIRGTIIVRLACSPDALDAMEVDEFCDMYAPTDNDVYAANRTNDRPPVKGKRSTERGDGRKKLISALTKHHEYADGGCLNTEPIGNNELARLAKVDQATASAFFKRKFKGHGKYKAACADATKLTAMLKLLNGEYCPHLLYGDKPPGERERDEE
jgi:hypothetical protein